MSRATRAVVICYVLAGFVALLAAFALHGHHPVAVAGGADLAATLAVFAFSLAFGNSSFYDAYWSVAPLPIALYWVGVADDGVPGLRQVLVVALVAAWGARLTWNWYRGWTGLDHEDWRYVNIRETTGSLYWPASFFGLHLFPTVQVFLGCLALWPALAVGTRPLGLLDAAALALTGGAIWLEARADQELRAFRRNPDRTPEDILETGVWAWSRHPNYLGEMGFWWGLWLFGVAAAPSAWWWTLSGPVAMTLMFRFASIPMIENRMAERRPGWPDHVRRVPIVPFLGRRSA
jgi:steroid 5-alpha reductase family enzyme